MTVNFVERALTFELSQEFKGEGRSVQYGCPNTECRVSATVPTRLCLD